MWRQYYLPTIGCLIFLSICTGCASKQTTKAELRQLLREEPELVLDVLKENNQELLKTIVAAEVNRAIYANREKMIREAEHPLAIRIKDSTPHEGPLDAPVKLVFFADFLCPFCKKSGAVLDRYIARAGAQKVLLVPRFYGSDDVSYQLAKCYLALNLQTDRDPALPHKFRKRIFAEQNQLRTHPEIIGEIINDLGADINRLNADMKSKKIEQGMADTYGEVHRLHIAGTPTFIINGISHAGNLETDQLDAIVALSRNAAKGDNKNIRPLVERIFPLAEATSPPRGGMCGAQ